MQMISANATKKSIKRNHELKKLEISTKKHVTSELELVFRKTFLDQHGHIDGS